MLEIRAHAGGRLLAVALSIALLGWTGAANAGRPDTDPVMSVFDDEEEYEDDGGGEEDYEDDGEEEETDGEEEALDDTAAFDGADEDDEGEEEEEGSEEEEENTEEELGEADEAEDADESDEGDEGEESEEGDEPADDEADADEELDSADDADDDAGTDDADAESDAEDTDGGWSEEELEALQDDNEDDSWADVWEEESDEADDAIPVDDNYDDDMVWEVVEVVTAADDDEAESDEDAVGTGAMLSVRSGKARTKPAGKPATPRPGKPGDDEDTVYAYGGRPVSALSVPWQAQIFYPSAPPKANDKRPSWQRQHYCGGALIAPDWVVTAAHCIDQQMVDLGFKVRLGTLDISRGDGAVYRIDRIVRHSQYDPENNNVARPPNMYANDIALVRIAADGRPPVRDPKRIREIPINRRPLPPGVPVSATGWGVTGSENADAINAVMLRVDLQLMDIPVCQQRPGYGPQKIHTNVFCASHPTRSTCRGDSGGPVVLTNGAPTLVGIVSWGKRKCAGDGRPGVYTRVDRYADWIDKAMKLPAGKNAYP